MSADTYDTVAIAAPAPRTGLLRGLRGKWTRRALAVMVTLFGAFVTLSFWAEPGAPVVFDSGTMVASGRLQAVLNAPTIGERIEGPSAGAPFTDKAGRKCRPFAQGAVDGTACQVEGGWRIIEMHQR